MNDVEPEELTNWLAVAWIDGWGEDYMRSATITQMVHSILAWLSSATAVRNILDFMPKQARPIYRKRKAKTSDSTSTLAWMQNMIRRK